MATTKQPKGTTGPKSTSNRGPPATPVKRILGEHSDCTPAKSPKNNATPRASTPRTGQSNSSYQGSSNNSPSQPKEINLPHVKRLSTTPYNNAMTFVAKVVRLEPRRRMFDSRVQLHRQKVVFADSYTLLVAYMHTDRNEDSSDPKLMEGYTYAITNFRVVKQGDILIHDATLAEL